MVFWVMTLCRDVVGYQRFREPYCFHVQGEDGGTSLHGITTQKTTTLIFISMETSNLVTRKFGLFCYDLWDMTLECELHQGHQKLIFSSPCLEKLGGMH
jgi:hypothetical protein